MTKITVKRIYWECEDPIKFPENGTMIFELEDGIRMELVQYAEEPAEAMGRGIEVLTGVKFVRTYL